MTQITDTNAARGCRPRTTPRMSNLLILLSAIVCSPAMGNPEGDQIIINEPSFSENKDPASDYPFSASVFWQAQRKLVDKTNGFHLTVRCGGRVIKEFGKKSIRLNVYTKDYKSENTTTFDVPCSSNCSLNISAIPYDYTSTTPVPYQAIFFATGAHAPLKPPTINEVGIVDSVVSVHWKVDESDSCAPIQNVELMLRSGMNELQLNSTNTSSPYVINLHQHPSTSEIAQNNFISLNVSLRYSNYLGTSKWSWFPASGSGTHSINTTYIQEISKNEFIIIGSVSVGMVVCFVIISIGIIAAFCCYSSKRKRNHRVVDRTHLQPPELTEESLSTILPDVDTAYQRSDPDDKDEENSDCSYLSNNEGDVGLLSNTNVDVPSHYVQL